MTLDICTLTYDIVIGMLFSLHILNTKELFKKNL